MEVIKLPIEGTVRRTLGKMLLISALRAGLVIGATYTLDSYLENGYSSITARKDVGEKREGYNEAYKNQELLMFLGFLSATASAVYTAGETKLLPWEK